MNLSKSVILLFVLVFLSNNLLSQKYIACVKDTKSSKWGYINERGDFIIPPIYNYAYPFSKCGFAGIYDNLNDLVYYINIKGDTVLRSTEEYSLKKSMKGYPYVAKVIENSLVIEANNKKKGIIDTDGEIIVEAKYDTLSPFINDIAVGKVNGAYHLINRDGKEKLVSIQELKSLSPFNNGRALFETYEGKKGYLNKEGEVVIKPIYEEGSAFSNNLAIVGNSTGFMGVIDTLGNQVIQFRFKNIHSFEEGADWTVGQNETRHGIIIYKNGTTKKIENCHFVYGVSNDLVAASTFFTSKEKRKDKDKKWSDHGYISKTGDWAIFPQFDDAKPFSDDYAVVRKNRLYGFVDKYGVWAVKPQFVTVFNMVRLDELSIEPKQDDATQITFDDIRRYFDVLEGINSLAYNSAELRDKSNKYWDLFFNQDYKFTNWLLGFKSDTLNYGLWKRVDQVLGNINNGGNEKCDAETARQLLLIYLNKDINIENNHSIENIEEFLNGNTQQSIPLLREEWRKVSLDNK